MRSPSESTLRAGVFLAGEAGACALGLLVWCSAAILPPPFLVWLFVVGSAVVSWGLGGGAGWAMIVRPHGRPSGWTAVAAALLGALLGYVIHAGIVILAVVTQLAFGRHDPVKEQGSPTFFAMVLGYPISAVLLFPAAAMTGAALDWADRRRPADRAAGTRGRPGPPN